ncbi:hypothetical protein ACFX13_028510 [Malus domestica]
MDSAKVFLTCVHREEKVILTASASPSSSNSCRAAASASHASMWARLMYSLVFSDIFSIFEQSLECDLERRLQSPAPLHISFITKRNLQCFVLDDAIYCACCVDDLATKDLLFHFPFAYHLDQKHLCELADLSR